MLTRHSHRIRALLRLFAGLLAAGLLLPCALTAQPGIPHAVYGTVRYSGGSIPTAVYFSAYITSRPSEVLTEHSTGCGYDAGSGQWYVQCGNFSSAWSPGERLHADFLDASGVPGSTEVTLTSNPSDKAADVLLARGIYPVTVSTTPSGLVWTADGEAYTTAHTFDWEEGSLHTLSVSSPQYTSTDIRQVFISWTNGGAQTQEYTVPRRADSLKAVFTTQVLLTLNSEYGTPEGGGWYDQGTNATFSIDAEVEENDSVKHSFSGWTGAGAGSYSGPSRTVSLVMNGPVSETAFWTPWFFLFTDASPADGGSVVPSPPGRWYMEGDTAIVEAFPDTAAGYDFEGWTGALTGNGNPATLAMTRPASVTACFEYVRVDTTPPLLVTCFPVPGVFGAPRNSPILCAVRDPLPGEGIDRSSVQMSVNGTSIVIDGMAGNPEETAVTAANGIRVVWEPKSAFSLGDTVRVRIEASDSAIPENSLDSTSVYLTGPSLISSSQAYRIPPRGVTLEDNLTRLRLNIPSLALSDTTDVWIGLVNAAPDLPPPVTSFGLLYYLGPYGQIYLKPITLEIPYTAQDLASAGVSHPMEIPVYSYCPRTGLWEPLPIVRYTPDYIHVQIVEPGYVLFCNTGSSGETGTPFPKGNGLTLGPNYPNPFNSGTLIHYFLDRAGPVSLSIWNNAGQKVKHLSEGLKNAGAHESAWDGTDDSGIEAASGLYFIILKSNGKECVQKASLIR